MARQMQVRSYNTVHNKMQTSQSAFSSRFMVILALAIAGGVVFFSGRFYLSEKNGTASGGTTVASDSATSADGTALNGLRNLMTVCKVCHDKHHADEIELKQVLITSKGEKRVSTVTKKIVVKKKYTQEQETLIRKCILKNSGLQPELIRVILSNDNIQVTVADIKKFISHPLCG